MRRLLDPASIAFVGGRRAALAQAETRRLGFAGPVWMVHPEARFPTLSSLPDVPDAVFVGVGAERSIEMAAEAQSLGVGGCVVYAAGFAEAGRQDLERKLVDAAGRMPIVGPNCHGFVNAMTGAALWPDVVGGGIVEGGVGLITQSGNIAIDVTMQRRGLDIAMVVTLGNQATVDIAAVVQSLLEDPRITAIGLHVEGIPDSLAFARAAQQAADRGIPIVALLTGTSRRGSEIVTTHTASIVDSMQTRRALLRRYGVTCVDGVDELVGALSVLSGAGRLTGTSVVSLSCSGGEASLVADLAAATRLSFDQFSPTATARLHAVLDGRVAIANPLDYHTFIWGDPVRLRQCFEAAVGDGCDAAVLVIDMPSTEMDTSEWWAALDAFGTAVERAGVRGVVTSTLPENLSGDVAAELGTRGLAVVPGLRTCLSALGAALPALSSAEPHVQPSRFRVGDRLDEWDSKRWLGARGIPIPRAALIDRHAAVAGDVGFPMVAKVRNTLHKTELGGVVTGITSPAALRAAIGTLPPGEVFVEQHIEDVTAELLVGITAEPNVGWALTVGSGGVLAELVGDTVTELLPAGDVESMLRRLRVWGLLAGHRGRPAAAVGEAVRVIGEMCRLAVSEAVQIEVNPLLVGREGVWVVDAIVEVLV